MKQNNNLGVWTATGGLFGSIAGIARNYDLMSELLNVEYGIFGKEIPRSSMEVSLDLLTKSLDEIVIGAAAGLVAYGAYKVYNHWKGELK